MKYLVYVQSVHFSAKYKSVMKKSNFDVSLRLFLLQFGYI